MVTQSIKPRLQYFTFNSYINCMYRNFYTNKIILLIYMHTYDIHVNHTVYCLYIISSSIKQCVMDKIGKIFRVGVWMGNLKYEIFVNYLIMKLTWTNIKMYKLINYIIIFYANVMKGIFLHFCSIGKLL
jgi:hypothetical protein